ncbi:MAG: TolC family protein [Bacteroidota bacterium]|nr:TolC family protein [Bacteroidota bacterium]
MKKLLVILCVLIIPACLFSQHAAEDLSFNRFEDLWLSVQKNNPTKRVYDLNIQKAQWDFKVSKGFLYPTVAAGFTGQDNLVLATTPIPGEIFGQPGKIIYTQFGQKYVYNTGVTITQSLFDWQSNCQAQLAKNNIALSQVQGMAYEQTLKQQAAQFYYTALIAKAAIHISGQDLMIADSIAKIAAQRLQEGVIDAASANQAMINYNSVLQNQLQNKLLFEQSIQNLKILLGVQPADSIELKEDIVLDAYKQMQDVAIGDDKNLLVYEAALKNAKLQEKVQRSATIPKLGLDNYLGEQQYRKDLGMSFSSGAWTPNQYLALNLSVPIFTGFSTKNKIRSAETSARISEQQYKNAQLQSIQEDSLLLSSLANNKMITAASERNFYLYHDNCRLVEQKYKEGVTSIDVYLKSFEDYLKAENAHLNNLAALYNNYSVIQSRR